MKKPAYRLRLMIRSPNGYPLQSPYLSMVNQAAKQIRLYAGEFGLSPGARAGLPPAQSSSRMTNWSNI
jgi:hypothetical protein